MLDDKRFTEIESRVTSSRLRRLSSLARLAELDPRSDFRGADLRYTDLRNDDLRGFVLSGADLRGANLKGCKLPPSALADALILDIPHVSFEDRLGLKYSPRLREVLQRAAFSDRYYQRIAYLAVLAILFWDQKLLSSLSPYFERQRSQYANSFYEELLEGFPDISDPATRRIAIAKRLRRFRYPLDGQRLEAEIVEIRNRFPDLKSVFRPTYT